VGPGLLLKVGTVSIVVVLVVALSVGAYAFVTFAPPVSAFDQKT